MRAFVAAAAVLSTAALGAATGPGRAAPSGICVGSQPGCYQTVQAAVDAAHDGDRIRIGPGTYAGGIVLNKSVELKGAGANVTTVEGGGPVVTIGVLGAADEPTVTLSGLTISGGVNAGDTTITAGGGLLIPAAAGGATGATVTVSDSVITGNSAAPTFGAPIGPPCPGGPCAFALGNGGGIASWGRLMLVRTKVSDNEAGGTVASDSHGGGIWSAGVASLTLESCSVTGNHSRVVPPNGRFAIGGGVHIQDGGSLRIANSDISGNDASLSSNLPGGISMIANGGGVHIGDGSSVTIDNTRINDNRVVVEDVNGQPSGFDAGMIVGGSTLDLRNSTVDRNQVVAHVAATDDNGASGGVLEVDGQATIENTRITANAATVTSVAGNAAALGAVEMFASGPSSIVNTLVSGNTLRASTTTGSATVQGAGLVNNGPLELRNVRVTDNSGTAHAPTGLAQGAGIWNGVVFNPPPVQLTLTNTIVTRNSLAASSGVAVQGAGLYTQFPVTLVNSRVEKNTPDDCAGC